MKPEGQNCGNCTHFGKVVPYNDEQESRKHPETVCNRDPVHTRRVPSADPNRPDLLLGSGVVVYFPVEPQDWCLGWNGGD